MLMFFDYSIDLVDVLIVSAIPLATIGLALFANHPVYAILGLTATLVWAALCLSAVAHFEFISLPFNIINNCSADNRTANNSRKVYSAYARLATSGLLATFAQQRGPLAVLNNLGEIVFTTTRSPDIVVREVVNAFDHLNVAINLTNHGRDGTLHMIKVICSYRNLVFFQENLPDGWLDDLTQEDVKIWAVDAAAYPKQPGSKLGLRFRTAFLSWCIDHEDLLEKFWYQEVARNPEVFK